MNAPQEVSSRGAIRTLLTLAVLHFVVDVIAAQLNPLWPGLKREFGLSAGEVSALYFLWTVTNSGSQLAFGLLGHGTFGRWSLWYGPALAAVCLGSIGLMPSGLLLGLLIALGGLGIAAFHPEGATLAGSTLPQARSRAMSIFAMGGFLGQSVGPSISGGVADRFGLSGLAWGISIGLLALLALRLQWNRCDPPPLLAQAKPVSPKIAFAGRWHEVGLLFLVGSLRFIASAGIPLALAFLLEARGLTKAELGHAQSAFLLGIGIGGFACAITIGARWERTALWLSPVLAVPFVFAIPHCSGSLLLAITCVAGLLLGLAQPVFISFGQQLFPAAPRVASSITMGVSWGSSGAIVALIMSLCQRFNALEVTFPIFALTTIASSALCFLLPKLSHQTHLKTGGRSSC